MNNRLAFDKSARTLDQAGHLHVRDCRISRVQVAGYLGKEIPSAERYGLAMDQTYPLLRPAEELAKSVPSWNGKPVMLSHRPQMAGDHDADVVCGSVSNCRFENPFLVADLAIWTDEAIGLIESGEQKQLSAGYFYEFDPTPQNMNGQRASGAMRAIRANHVALVPLGRAGAECMVGDAAIGNSFPALERGRTMSTQLAIREMQSIRAAEEEVEPVVGAVLGMDSAAKVYAEGLRRLGLPESTISPLQGNGAQAVFRSARTLGRDRPHVAMDSRAIAHRSAMYPNWDRLAGGRH